MYLNFDVKRFEKYSFPIERHILQYINALFWKVLVLVA